MDDHILTALVLTLANQLREKASASGVQTTSDYTQEAVRLIQQKQASVLGLFGQRAGL
jgi:hypothetical protein